MRIVDLFVQILNMSISASIVVILLTLLRVIFRRQMTAGFKYLMWALVSVRLWLPFSLPLEFSLFNLFSQGQARPSGPMVSIEYIETNGTYIPLEDKHLNLYLIGTAIWLCGCLLLALYQLGSLLYTKHLCRDAMDIEERDLLENCIRLTAVKEHIGFCLSERFDSPVAVGLFRTKIILPPYLEVEDSPQLRHILLHELVHIRRKDRWLKLFMALTMTLHWFNPVLWLCCREVLNDMETSCDEQVLSMLDRDETVDYARTLLAVSINQKRRFDLGTFFADKKELIDVRVLSALEYKPLSPLKRVVLALTMTVLALVTTTNPIAAYDGYIPAETTLSAELFSAYEAATRVLCDSLSAGNVDTLLNMSRYNDTYYQDIYSVLAQEPLPVTHYRLYPQNERLVYAYLLCEDKREYVAQLREKDNEILVISLQDESSFASTHTVRDNEAVRFVRNLHRFGIVCNEAALSDWSIAALCISEEHYDRVKSGEISEDTVYLPEDWVNSAAETYFGRKDFSYTLDEEMYDADLQSYIYLPEREDPANAEVLSCEENNGAYTVTARLYRDPLKLLPQATITYQLASKVSQ